MRRELLLSPRPSAARGPGRDSKAREPLTAWESGIRLRLPKVAKRSASGGFRSPKRHRCRCCRAKAALGGLPPPRPVLPRCTRGLSGAPFYSCLYCIRNKQLLVCNEEE